MVKKPFSWFQGVLLASMSKIPFNQVSLMSTILDIPFLCVKRVGIAMAQTKTCKSWLIATALWQLWKSCHNCCAGRKKSCATIFFLPRLLICQYQPKNTCGGKYKKLPQGGEIFLRKLDFAKITLDPFSAYTVGVIDSICTLLVTDTRLVMRLLVIANHEMSRSGTLWHDFQKAV